MNQEISSIKEKYLNYLKLRNFSHKSIKSYLLILEDFLKSSNNLSNEEVKDYLLKGINKKQSSSYIKQKYAAIKILGQHKSTSMSQTQT